MVVIGGGLAGLAAAQALGASGHQVIVLESRQRLGGRAGSFTDAKTGQMIDTCQHVSMGCCTNLARFFATVGVQHLLSRQAQLWFVTADGQCSRLTADRLPAPFHLARSFLRLHFLTWREKFRIAAAFVQLRRADRDSDSPFLEWLQQQQQSRNAIDRFWTVVIVSALNESIDRVGLKYARKVFVDAFMGDRHGCTIEVPKVPLDRLYGPELHQWFAGHGVDVRTNAGVSCAEVADDRVSAVVLRDGTRVDADWFVSAIPPDRLRDILPQASWTSDSTLHQTEQLQTSPIVSVHLWYDRQVLKLPNLVLVDGLGQWVFNRNEIAPGEWYIQVVISAARVIAASSHSDISQTIIAQLHAALPSTVEARLVRSRVVIEHAATISVVPGVDQFRPGATCSIRNLILAGDWTRTGWPATMEGAVISGYRAAETVVAECQSNLS